MKKFFSMICALVIGLVGCSVQEVEVQTTPTHNVYEMNITATQLSNDSVGREWSKTYWCKGEAIESKTRWTVPIGETSVLEVDIMITEHDKFPDVGRGALAVELSNGFESSTIITVTENKGAYKGNQAQWEIVCKVVLVGEKW